MNTRRKRLDEKSIARTLGASRIEKLTDRQPGGPLEWIHMGLALQDRLISRGGRPSDPRWDTKRLVPFQRKTWDRLKRKASLMSARGRKVGPAQLAALLIERNLH